MRINLMRLLCCLGLIVVIGCAPTIPTLGSAIVSKSFVLDRKPIAIVYEVRNSDASHLLYLSCLAQAFMKSGYTVMERFQLDAVINELKLDQTGAVKDSLANGSSDLSPSAIKRIGNLYGIKYLAFFGRWKPGTSYLRIVDCESAEVVSVNLMSDETVTNYDPISAELLVMAIEYSAKLRNETGKPTMVSIAIRSDEISDSYLSFYDIEKMLFQKKYGPYYGIIYLNKEKETNSSSIDSSKVSGNAPKP